MAKLTKRITFLKKENAQTMVEFALVFPVILLITYGILEFGRILFTYTAMTGAAREGARYGATASTYQNCNDIILAARSKAFLISPSSVNVLITYTHDGATVACGTTKLVLGDRITVKVTTNYSPIIPLPGLPPSLPITRQSTRTLLLGVNIQTAPP